MYCIYGGINSKLDGFYEKIAFHLPMFSEIMIMLWLLFQSILYHSYDDVTHAVIRLWKIEPFTGVRHILFHKGQYFCHKACNAAPYLQENRALLHSVETWKFFNHLDFTCNQSLRITWNFKKLPFLDNYFEPTCIT